jgi:heat shock protein HtpX
MKRVALFLVTNIAILLVLSVQGVDLDLRALLIFAAVFGMGGSFISLAISKWTAKRFTGARVIEQPRDEAERWLVETVQRQAGQAGIGMPEVAVYEAPEMNAFATGARRNNALVAVSTGLMQRMSREEVEAVLAHEVSHVANGDMITLALIQGVVNTFVIFLSRVIGHVVDRVVFKNQRGHGPAFWIATIVAQLVLGRRRRRCAPRRTGKDGGGASAPEAGRRRAPAARSDGGLRHFRGDRSRLQATVHDPPPSR